MTAVRISHISKRFGRIRVLDDVSLDISEGELFFLLGPSGCGKTTLLRTIAGFCKPDSGELYFDSQKITRTPAYLRKTGMVFQNYALWPHMSVWENVAFGLQQQKLGKDEIARRTQQALEQVQMQAYAQAVPPTLSGGQQQRVALARAVAARPDCLLLDEPLCNLDTRLRSQLRREVREVCKQSGLTAVYVTHDQKEALEIADRLAVMRDGKICQVGVPREVYRRPTSRFVASFMGESDFFEGELLYAGAGEGLIQTALGQWRAALSGADETAFIAGAKATLCIRPQSWHLDDMPADENCIEGRVEESLFMGELTQLGLVCAHDSRTRIRAFSLDPHGRGIGQSCYAWVDPDDAVILLN